MELQSLVERAWDLHDRLNDEIRNSINFCKFCCLSGRCCDFAETPSAFEDRERLIAIRDSLKQVGDMLIHLQRLQPCQLIDKNAALTRLEESRLFLIQQVTKYQGRDLDVVKELNACFSNQKTALISWNLNQTMKKNASHVRKRRLFGFLNINCVRSLFDPWKWHIAVGFAMKLIVVSASISSAVHLYSSHRRINLSIVDTEKDRKIDTLLTISMTPLDVFYGRG